MNIQRSKYGTLSTAYNTFLSNLNRAKNILNHAKNIQNDTMLQEDLLRSSLMFGIGAVDCYFCDAYSDLLTRFLRADAMFTQDPSNSSKLPTGILNMSIPIKFVLDKNESTKRNTKLRKIAESKIEKESILSTEKILKYLNQFFLTKEKPLHPCSEYTGNFIKKHKYKFVHEKNKINKNFNLKSQKSYNILNPTDKKICDQYIMDTVKRSLDKNFQRRHDCIHNCDRPNSSIQKINQNEVQRVLTDIEILIETFNEKSKELFKKTLSQTYSSVISNRCTT